ncbi:hypothetical protein D3C76_978200 [compost metagenome]
MVCRTGGQGPWRSPRNRPAVFRHRYTPAPGCGGRGSALELPAVDGRVEVRAGIGRRQQCGTQAFGKITPERIACCRAGDASRYSCGRVQRRAGRRQRGQGVEPASGCRLHRLHGVGPGRPRNREKCRGFEPQARLAGTGWQIGQHRHGRLPGYCSGGAVSCSSHFCQHGPGLQCRFAVAGAAFGCRCTDRPTAGSHQGLSARASAGPANRYRCNHR